MEKWHKIGVFIVGLIGLVSYLYHSAKNAAEKMKEDSLREEKQEVLPQKNRLAYQAAFLVAVIVAMFIVPKLIGDIVTFLFPEPEKTSLEIIFKFLQALFYLGERHFGNESYFFEGQGLMLLEWLFILAPYIIGFTIWSIRIIFRRVRI